MRSEEQPWRPETIESGLVDPAARAAAGHGMAVRGLKPAGAVLRALLNPPVWSPITLALAWVTEL
jgi:hypothetical protein